MKISKLISALLLVVILILSLMRILNPEISSGQVGKPAFQLELMRSFQQGVNQGLFPVRRFVELEFSGPILWAEELPVYTGIVGIVARVFSGFDLVILSKLMTALAIPLFLYSVLCSSALALNRKVAADFRWHILFFAANLPVIRLYWNHPMPDFWMFTAVVASWLMAFQGRYRWAFVLGGLAIGIKYYAAFSLFSVFIFWFLEKKRSYSETIKTLIFGLIVSLPAVLYIYYFTYNGIPNPIQQYAAESGSGHFASGREWLSLKFYSRMVTWLWVKNPGLIQSALALVGVYAVMSKKESRMIRFLFSFLIGQLIFVFVFSSSFYVHDYYGLQWALLTILFSVLGFLFLTEKVSIRKWGAIALPALLILAFIEGQMRTASASRHVAYYPETRQIWKTLTDPNSKGLLLGDRYLAALAYDSEQRVTWIAPFSVLGSENKTQILHKRLSNPEVTWIGFFHVDTPINDPAIQTLQNQMQSQGWEFHSESRLNGAVFNFWTRVQSQ